MNILTVRTLFGATIWYKNHGLKCRKCVQNWLIVNWIWIDMNICKYSLCKVKPRAECLCQCGEASVSDPGVTVRSGIWKSSNPVPNPGFPKIRIRSFLLETQIKDPFKTELFLLVCIGQSYNEMYLYNKYIAFFFFNLYP